MSRKKIIFYVLLSIGLLWLFIKADMDSLDRGEIVMVNANTFGTRHYKTHQELESAAYHEDQVAILQLMYDGKARHISYGTKGRVITDVSKWVEIRFDDDPITNWWVKGEFVERVK